MELGKVKIHRKQEIGSAISQITLDDDYNVPDYRPDIVKVLKVHYEIEILANGFEWLVHTTQLHTVGSHVGIRVIPFNIQIMNKPESEDEEAVEIDV